MVNTDSVYETLVKAIAWNSARYLEICNAG